MAWLKKKFQGAMEKLEKDDKQKPTQLVDEDSASVTDLDIPEVKVTSPDNATPVTALLSDDDDNENQDENNELENASKNSDISDSDRESPKKTRKSSSDEKETESSHKKKGKSDSDNGKKSGKSDSDKESGKKSSKSSPETGKKSPEKKKDKVKTHRRVSSASALSAIGGFIKKGHKRERSDGGIVIDPKLVTPEKQERPPSEEAVNDPAHIHQSHDFRESSVLIKEKKKELAKEAEKLSRSESPFGNVTLMPKSASEHAFRVSNESPIMLGDEREFTNMSFVCEGEDKDETVVHSTNPFLATSSPSNHGDEAKIQIQDTLKQWQLHSTNIEQMYDLASRMIEKRKADLMLAVTEISNELQSQLQSRYAKESQEATQIMTKLHELNDEINSNAWGTNNNIQITDLPRKPATEPFEMGYDKDTDPKVALSDIFGHIATKPIPQVFGVKLNEGKKKDKNPFTKDKSPEKVVRKYVPETNGLLVNAEFGGSFSTKTSKDVRECGITDMSLTNNNEIVVVDRHNKLVKVFDYKGTLLRYIGRHSLKQPSRATVLPWNNQILVSDNASQTVNLYHSNGSILSNFADDLKFPIAHCVVGTNQVAVVDFDPKEVVVYTFDQNGGGYSRTFTFPILMECPAYIAATPEGNIVVSDWSRNTVKIFDHDGNVINQISKVGTAPNELKKPQGVASDCHGNVFVMEQTNKRIQLFNNEGSSVHVYDRTCHEFGVPMCLKATSDGHFILCEYQGNVKLFKYMDLPNLGLFNYEAPPPRPSVPAPSNAIWPIADSPQDEAESMF